MSPENFIYWLQGVLEIADPKSLDQKQLQIIKDHIALVLKKETPKRSEPTITVTPTPPGVVTLPYVQPAIGPYRGGAAQVPYCTKGPLGTRCNQLTCTICNGPLIAVC